MDAYLTIKLLQISIIISGFFFLVVIFTVLWKNKDEIRAFFNPNGWSFVTMIEMDNNVLSWLEKKTKDLKFRFNDGSYNMFHKGDIITETRKNDKGEEELFTYLKKNPPIYRSGRLSAFLYIEGNEDPVDLRKIEVTGNPQINEQLLKVDISRFFTSTEGLAKELWDKFGIFIVIGIVILLLVLLLRKPDAKAGEEAVKNIVFLTALWKSRRR